jgi:hypothetical protein
LRVKGVLAKIHVQDYGRIADAQIELRPLTVFIGPNNTNKTWVAYAIHGLVQSLSASRFFFRVNSAMEPIAGFDAPQEIVDACNAAVERLSRDLSASHNGGTYLTNLYRGELLDRLEIGDSVDFSIDADGLARLLALDAAPSKTARVTLSMEASDFLHGGLINRLEIQMNEPTATLRTTAFDSSGQPRDAQVSLGYHPGDRSATEIRRTIGQFVRWMALGIFQGGVAFPAERNGLLSTYPLILDRIGEQGGLLSHASQDFIRLLRDADVGRRSEGGPCRRINEMLEKAVLGGGLAFDPSRESAGLTYTIAGGPPVGVEAAASMIRSLAGLHCYFRISALEQDLIIMDEPEMNAHPEAQVRLMEFFAELVRRRFRVLLTTHSPYMLDHLNNLLAMSKIPLKSRQDLVREYGEGIDPNHVAVYEFTESGEVIDRFNRNEELLDLQTFSEPSDRVSNLYSKILSLQAET